MNAPRRTSSAEPLPMAAPASARSALVIGVAALLALAVAMGIGRFAFTPMFPLMVRDGVLDHEGGALLAASNYLGYLVGALAAAKIRLRPALLLAAGLVLIVLTTAAVGATESLAGWTVLRFIAGVMSAWTLVATSAWGLGWLAALQRPQWAGAIFAGVGIGIAAAGLFCLVAARPEVSSGTLWIELGLLAAVAALPPLWISRKYPLPPPAAQGPAAAAPASQPNGTGGLIVCYTLFGFGYILPATYLPALARQLVDDPQVFGWAWPLFGLAAALSTMLVAWGLQRADRMLVWAVCHLLMAFGVWLPTQWATLAGIAVAALLVGGTFMVITMIAMQEGRARASGRATVLLGQMTAGFALGQLLGPVVAALVGRLMPTPAAALDLCLQGSAVALAVSAPYLWRQAGRARR